MTDPDPDPDPGPDPGPGPGPGVEEMTTWRSLLDGLGQAVVGWDAVQDRLAGGEPVRLPPAVVESLARAGQESAEALAGLADLLAGTDDPGDGVRDAAVAQRAAAQAWARAREHAGHGDGPGDVGESGTDRTVGAAPVGQRDTSPEGTDPAAADAAAATRQAAGDAAG